MQFGNYQILRELGRGASGITYLALDPALRRQVALKVLELPRTIQGTAHDGHAAARFSREAKAVASIKHPCIPQIFDHGQDQGRFYIAMEYCEGSTLGAMLNAQGSIAESHAIQIVRQLLGALQAAHDRGIYHRDVKPENIIVQPDGAVKLLDFGIARVEGETTLTHTGAALGTPAYMAPEQIHGKPVDGRTDLFAMGVILHELLTGARPFQGQSTVEITHSIAYKPPQIVPGLPHYLRQVIETALQKDPSQRFASATHMSNALASQVTGTYQGASTPPPGTGPTLAGTYPTQGTYPAQGANPTQGSTGVLAHPPKPSQLGLWAVLGGVALCVIILVVSLYPSLTKPSTPPPPPPPLTMPVLRGNDVADATRHLEGLRLRVATRQDYDDSIAIGHVYGTAPREGSILTPGSEVVLYVSRGPRPKPGPTFSQADSILDDNSSTHTEARKVTYLNGIKGTQVTWVGTLLEASLDDGGALHLKCNLEGWWSGADTIVKLDGTQRDLVGQLVKGNYVTIVAILRDHDRDGYTLDEGRIVSSASGSR